MGDVRFGTPQQVKEVLITMAARQMPTGDQMKALMSTMQDAMKLVQEMMDGMGEGEAITDELTPEQVEAVKHLLQELRQ